MPEFLSSEWIDWINQRLAACRVDQELFDANAPVRVVFELLDSPANLAHAVTFYLDSDGAWLALGDYLAADLIVSLSYEDARLLTTGEVEGAKILREGRLKIRGDVNALVPFGNWMVAAQNSIV